jgi:hypothetical protein
VGQGFLAKTRVVAIALTIALLAGPALAAPDRVALVVGNSAYQNAAMLPNPSNDAAAVAAALRKIGFDVIEGRDLPKRAMEEKIIEFSRKLDHASLALFFYAGHGLQISGHNYLLPIDAALERPGDLSFETIDLSLVLDRWRPRNGSISCSSTPAATTRLRNRSRGRRARARPPSARGLPRSKARSAP